MATFAWKLMGISFSERKSFPVTFLHGEVRNFPEGSEDDFFICDVLQVCPRDIV